MISKSILFSTSQIGFGGGERVFEDLVRAARKENMTVTCAVPRDSLLASRLGEICDVLDIERELDGREFDLLIANDFESFLMCRHQSKKRHFICHGPWEYTLRKALTLFLHRCEVSFISTYVALSAPKVTRIFGQSNFLAYGPDPIFSKATNLEKMNERKKLKIPSDAFIAANVARFHPVKRLTVFLEIVQSSRIFGALALSTGFDTPEEKKAFDEFNSYLRDVEDTSVILNSNPEPVLAASDVFVCTSKSETLGVAMLEAGSFGLPVICMAQGGPSDIVRPGLNGYLVVNIGVSEVVCKVNEIKVNHEMASNMSRLAKLYANSRTPSRALRQILGNPNWTS